MEQSESFMEDNFGWALFTVYEAELSSVKKT